MLDNYAQYIEEYNKKVYVTGENVSAFKAFLMNNLYVVGALATIVGATVLGYFTNPNSISFHRYYRKQLSDCYLQFADVWRNVPLKDLFYTNADKKGYVAPYPLINTCLNLQSQKPDKNFKGLKTNDYFLLSPLFSGSKLTGYVDNTHFNDYSKMTLPAATTISAAAVNPGMGIYSSPLLSVLMTIFNARLGFWITNPLKVEKYRTYTWWPVYFFKELFSTIGTYNKMVNISDGGHIENLAAYELIRRRCRLILCTDGGEDANYSFADLENLVVRARNELGVEIKFRKGQEPENVIRPKPSIGYSEQRFAIADMKLLWKDSNLDSADSPYGVGDVIGIFVYMKSSITAPTTKPTLSDEATREERLRFDTYKYKIYHPAFPHEPTSDQFFDEVQWESYFRLGQFIGADVLGLKDDPNKDEYDYKNAPKFTVEELIEHFSEYGKKLFEQPQEDNFKERGLVLPTLVKTDEAVEAPATETTEAIDEKGYRM